VLTAHVQNPTRGAAKAVCTIWPSGATTGFWHTAANLLLWANFIGAGVFCRPVRGCSCPGQLQPQREGVELTPAVGPDNDGFPTREAVVLLSPPRS